ncbi:MAG: bifunctional phosphopantothenoylcysteine decarboxylase/phosphopantothenate--cysteine ligase CoaBC [Proteobacteria bacterium]|jgi:phosphopantothenoylcysteine decarboxylase/phosphopantothenate--cysteine ligase|nr:bifunctional phosphopantothenoylcysteine decarboxylase/phosphopantothenate--cysteine ligase CoaBC [Pseudomonadota bacterium]NCV45516.1 bifunctional phosphopantothenoylcysteine decarboxylase/phosphopantothenate--cysteine ligase CoaBC [Pseudomonadota bacterium]NCV99352.1 bifunctional phosphopantothenoylcysteine decarboxylase/phosphopantothenate--cysteine ligase CoaBC [Pseudomonadota bacterium]NCW10583.1 bifunctional phosphopantothenoylcysteine decarboxylase/phosphopantothenate--cysteine ligase 
MLNFSNTNVLLCVTGGIAAYKSAEIIRLFKKDGADVRVIMTESAKEFITPLTLQAVSGNEIHDSLLDVKAESAMGHIELAKWADIILIAPCTAESLAKITHGRADDLMGSVILASNATSYIAPAMNTTMWLDKSTQENFRTLVSRGINFIGPDEGEQACGDVGPGRLVEPEKIIELIKSDLHKGPLSGKTITITAGPTREQIDPVRYISNNSSGKMGYALAEAAKLQGANVNLVSGPVSLTANRGINLFKINSAAEMLNKVFECMESSDIFISCAAVADFKPANYSDTKIKKEESENLEINLEKNHDILSEVSKRHNSAYIVGFAAETSNVNDNASKKLNSKNLNMIISNDVSDKTIGFDSDDNEVHVITKNETIFLKKDKKIKIAREILNIIALNIKS